MPPLKCVIHWINEDRWDVWPLVQVPSEIQYEGGIGLIKYMDGKSYLGKIIKVSGNARELEEAESKLHAEIEKSKVEVASKRKSVKPSRSGKRASDREISRAVGERPKLNTPQRQAKKKQTEANRAVQAAQKEAEEEEQNQLQRSGVARNLFPKGSSGLPTVNAASHDAQSDDDLADDDSEDDMLGEEDLQGGGHDQSGMPDASNGRSDEEDDGDMSDEGDNKAIKEFRNPNTERFLRYLLQCFGSIGNTISSSHEVSAIPLQVEGQRMVRLVKGHSLRICKGGRNMLIVDKKSQKSPSNFVRKTLVHLYGTEQLQQMTPMGRKKNSLCISKDDLAAIYDFISEHTTSMPWSEFIRTVSKKCSAVKFSPKASSKTKSTSKKQSPAKSDGGNSMRQSPAKRNRGNSKKQSPAKSDVGNSLRQSPAKSDSGNSMRQSPGKSDRGNSKEQGPAKRDCLNESTVGRDAQSASAVASPEKFRERVEVRSLQNNYQYGCTEQWNTGWNGWQVNQQCGPESNYGQQYPYGPSYQHQSDPSYQHQYNWNGAPYGNFQSQPNKTVPAHQTAAVAGPSYTNL